MTTSLRDNSRGLKAAFLAGGAAGFTFGLLTTPIWWVVDLVGLLLYGVGKGLSTIGEGIRNARKNEEVVETSEEAPAEDAGDAKPLPA